MYSLEGKRSKKWWFLFIVIIVVMILLLFGSRLASFFSWIFQPIQKSFYDTATSIPELKSRKDLITENEQLKIKIQNLAVDTSQIEILKSENQTLRQLLNFAENKNYKIVSAGMISAAAGDLNGFVINRGTANGITKGNAVVTENGVMVGKIFSAEENRATVIILSDNQSRVAGTILNQTKTIGLIIGERGLSVKLEMIPQNEEIKDSDMVVTSGLEEKIPAGLAIGVINGIEKKDNELFKNAYIDPLVDYNKIKIVSVIISK